MFFGDGCEVFLTDGNKASIMDVMDKGGVMGEKISWKGGERPVAEDATVIVHLEGDSFSGRAGSLYWDWRDAGTQGDILAYEVVDAGCAVVDAQRHSHYHKDVSHLKSIDVYRVLELFNVTDQKIGHAAKKLLVAGGRGHKDIDKDIQDAIDTLERWKEMRREDGGC